MQSTVIVLHPDSLPSADDCVQAIIESGGNFNLAVENLGLTNTGQLFSIISADNEAFKTLQQQMRSLTTMQVFQTMINAQSQILVAIPNMDADDLVKLFNGLVDTMAKLTQSDTQTHEVNIHEYVTRMLPRPIRDALADLLDNSPNDDTNLRDHNDNIDVNVS